MSDQEPHQESEFIQHKREINTQATEYASREASSVVKRKRGERILIADTALKALLREAFIAGHSQASGDTTPAEEAEGEHWYRCDECGNEHEADKACEECKCEGMVPFIKPYATQDE